MRLLELIYPVQILSLKYLHLLLSCLIGTVSSFRQIGESGFLGIQVPVAKI